LPKPLEDFTFFLDRTLGKNIFASSLRAAGLSVEIHDDHFPQDAKDSDWLIEVGTRKWIVLTNDRRIRYRPLELAALRASGVRAFVFTRGDLTAQEMASVFLGARPTVFKTLRRNQGSFVASISRAGQVRLIVRD